MIFEQKEKFFEWLKSVLKQESTECLKYSDSQEAWLDSVWEQYSTSGNNTFELSSYMTKSHKPECYDFEVIEADDVTEIIF